jgi:hypothetical protein
LATIFGHQIKFATLGSVLNTAEAQLVAVVYLQTGYSISLGVYANLPISYLMALVVKAKLPISYLMSLVVNDNLPIGYSMALVVDANLLIVLTSSSGTIG